MLYRIIPVVVFVGVIWALVVFPSFRVVAVILFGLGLVAYFALSEKAAQDQKEQAAKKEQERITFEAEQRDYCKDEQKRWTIVPGSMIELRNASLTQGQYIVND